MDEGQREFSVPNDSALLSDLEADNRFERTDDPSEGVEATSGISAYEAERLAKNELLRNANETSGGLIVISDDVKNDTNVDVSPPADVGPPAEGSIDDPSTPNADDVPQNDDVPATPEQPANPEPEIPPFVPSEPDPVVAGGENF